jgi:DNA-3-methyladenine glycosylase II
MGLPIDQLHAALAMLAGIEPAFARGIERVGLPPTRISDRGYATLLRTIVGQQVSVASARAVWGRMEALLGDIADPTRLEGVSDEDLRTAGLSRQKTGYARSLAGLVASGGLDLSRLAADDEQAIADLIRIKGIGRWSAEIYLLFAEGRPDIWPAGDLAVQVETGHILGLPERPSEKQTRTLAEAWRPHRGAAAIFAWHHYGVRGTAPGKDAAPV